MKASAAALRAAESNRGRRRVIRGICGCPNKRACELRQCGRWGWPRLTVERRIDRRLVVLLEENLGCRLSPHQAAREPLRLRDPRLGSVGKRTLQYRPASFAFLPPPRPRPFELGAAPEHPRLRFLQRRWLPEMWGNNGAT